MARDRDVAAFGGRAQRPDEGGLGELHHLIEAAAELALACMPAPRQGRPRMLSRRQVITPRRDPDILDSRTGRRIQRTRSGLGAA